MFLPSYKSSKVSLQKEKAFLSLKPVLTRAYKISRMGQKRSLKVFCSAKSIIRRIFAFLFTKN
jgi:hypothetical protein